MPQEFASSAPRIPKKKKKRLKWAAKERGKDLTVIEALGLPVSHLILILSEPLFSCLKYGHKGNDFITSQAFREGSMKSWM